MNEHDWLAERFEENRPHLRAVAYRMLGSSTEADDAVQEAWLRLSRAGTNGVDEPGRLAHHDRGAGIAEHAALADAATRGADRRAGHRATGHAAAERDRPGARGGAGRFGRASAAGGAGHADPGRTARVRAARHVRRAVRGDRPDRGTLPRRHPPAGQPGPPPGAGGPGRTRKGPATRTPNGSRARSRGGGRWSPPSWPPRGKATSTRCSPCSTRTSCCGPTMPPRRWARTPRRSARARWRASLSGRAQGAAARAHRRRRRARCGRTAARPGSCSPSRSPAARSPRSSMIADPERIARFDVTPLKAGAERLSGAS